MSTRAAEELYYDSEATLRLVDNVLDELQVMDEVGQRDEHGRFSQRMVRETVAAGELPEIIVRAYGEVQALLDSLRRSRDVLERTSAEKAHHMGERLRAVDAAAEVAATDILDGVDRALAVVDRLDDAPDDATRTELRGALREELFEVMGCLQFQDITSQQLNYASSVLFDMESRLGALAETFDPSIFGLARPATPRPTAARTGDCGCDQALVDEIFGG